MSLPGQDEADFETVISQSDSFYQIPFPKSAAEKIAESASDLVVDLLLS